MAEEDRAQRSREVRVTCACGTEFTSRVYQSVNVTLEPQLLYRLLAGLLNVATCPTCGRASSTAQPFLYHDMKRGLFAYVHPHADASDEEREELLALLRREYTRAVEASERIHLLQQARDARDHQATRDQTPRPTVRRRTPAEELAERIEPDAPPMQVIFGVDQLAALVESLLEPDEKPGKVALSTHSAEPAERRRLTQIAQRMAAQLTLFTDVEDTPGGYTVWIYGPRPRVQALAKAINQPA